MGHNATETCPSIALTGIASSRDPELVSQQSENMDAVSRPQEQLRLQRHDGEDMIESTRKKTMSFKLAFSGLALILLVFQIDVTCLSIALPVSQDMHPDTRTGHGPY
jgi:hypothetical protein